MMKTIALSAKQRQEIHDRRRQADDRRIFQRLSALLWIDEGRTREEVAELLGVSSRQVGDWLRIFRNKGLDELCTKVSGFFDRHGFCRGGHRYPSRDAETNRFCSQQS